MTLGKIERFWKTIYEEFLVRAQFVSFEEARERVRQWAQYYNHRRPHQGIGGLCPADRYFEIQAELRKTIEQGIADNVLEMALRGKPREPFYMVGRMEGQSVVLRAEKGSYVCWWMMRKEEESRRWSTPLPPEKKRRKGRRPMEKPEKPKARKPGMEGNRRGRRVSDHTAAEKCHAVLSVWTEKRRLGEVCRELGVAWSSLNQWQNRAMEESHGASASACGGQGCGVNPRLAVLLEQKIKGGVMKG